MCLYAFNISELKLKYLLPFFSLKINILVTKRSLSEREKNTIQMSYVVNATAKPKSSTAEMNDEINHIRLHNLIPIAGCNRFHRFVCL